MEALAPCPGCGARVSSATGPTHAYIGASAGCWAVFGEVIAREFSDPAYGRVHRLTVDAYAAQHPGVPERRSIQSVAVHLVALHLVFEQNVSVEHITERTRPMLEDRTGWTWLEPPSFEGCLTVLDVRDAKDAAAHGSRVMEWAEAVWRAWHAHHATVATWAQPTLR